MPRSSQLARLLQALLLVQLGAAAGWWTLWVASRPVMASLGAALILLATAIVLALEFFLLARFGYSGGLARPPAATLFRAWLAETREFYAVFCGRMPFAWRAVPDHLPSAARGKPGVVFVHGFMCNRGIWTPWLRLLRQRDHAFVAVNLEPVFTSIDRYAPSLDDAIRRVAEATGQPPLLVCHSMGGLAARAWLRSQPGNARRVRHLVTLGTPHQGTWLARFSQLPNGRQMRVGSDWLRGLAADELAQAAPPTTCWYAECDNIVFPILSATLPHADNRLVRGSAHVDLVFHAQVMSSTLEHLDLQGVTA